MIPCAARRASCARSSTRALARIGGSVHSPGSRSRPAKGVRPACSASTPSRCYASSATRTPRSRAWRPTAWSLAPSVPESDAHPVEARRAPPDDRRRAVRAGPDEQVLLGSLVLDVGDEDLGVPALLRARPDQLRVGLVEGLLQVEVA